MPERGEKDMIRKSAWLLSAALVAVPNAAFAQNNDTATQAMSSNYVDVADGRGEYRSIPFRYVWPAELDLMAELAGLRLRERWDGWTRQPFTHESRQHVSIWAKR